MSPQGQLLEAIARRESLQAELDTAALDVSRALMDLRWSGTPARELAEMLGVSRQRVYQVLERAARDLEASYQDRKEKEAIMRLSARRGGKQSGWRQGTPQCYACRRILTGYGQDCPCGGHSAPRDGARHG